MSETAQEAVEWAKTVKALQRVEGVGRTLSIRIAEWYPSVDRVRSSGFSGLAAVDGVSKEMAKRILGELERMR